MASTATLEHSLGAVDAGLGAPRAVPAPSDSQRAAIEAPAAPLLVLAGPGAGKTFCLIERIRFLLERLELSPDRICAFTFTNKAAGEIGERLERTLGERAARVKTGTIHSFCAELLREFGSRIGIERGFGIADEEYQLAVLRRLGYPIKYCKSLLSRFGEHRLRNAVFAHRNDAEVFERYERFLADRRVLDFDMLVMRTAELLDDPHVVHRVRARWDCVLVDEFQDLNPFQYQVIRELGRDHEHIFAVGDEEQSIYSWAGADPRVFVSLLNDFGLTQRVVLRENRRCSREILARARRLVDINTPMFADRKELRADRDSPFTVDAHTFATDDDEMAWVIDDLRRDREIHGVRWGEIALLYRRHDIGYSAEASLLAAGLPCRLAHGRALADDKVVAYVVAALGVIGSTDDIREERFLETVLPRALMQDARAKAEEGKSTLREQLNRIARALPRDHADARKIRRAFYALSNLRALGQRHTTITGLVDELLSQRVGTYRTVLEEHHDALSDPQSNDEVVRLAQRLAAAQEAGRTIWLERNTGVGIALKGMLGAAGIRASLDLTPPNDAECIVEGDASLLGLPLTVFKALQLMRSEGFVNVFRDFTAIDVETTDKDVAKAEVIEIAAVRVRDGRVVDEMHTLVRPRGRVTAGAIGVHGITPDQLAGAPTFEEAWPAFREFCGGDVLVAHNGYEFDFRILKRLTGATLATYDTLPLARSVQPGSAKLVDLARHYGIDPGASHRALDDTRTLARVCLALHEAKVTIARKTALANLLDYLGLALALSDTIEAEADLLRRVSRPYALGRYSDCLDFYEYERDHLGDPSLPTLHQVIIWLGGEELMQRVRAEKSAKERYPVAMARMRRLLEECGAGIIAEQIARFLERLALSQSDGAHPDRERVNLLTLHSTKGLEFSRVYILGVEDAQLIGGKKSKTTTPLDLEEARRLLYVGMTRAKDRLVLTHVQVRNGQPTGGHRFLDEMALVPVVVA